MLQKDVDQRPQLVVAEAVGDFKGQVGLAAAPVVQGKLAVEQARARAVEAVGQGGDDLAQESAQVGGWRRAWRIMRSARSRGGSLGGRMADSSARFYPGSAS